MPNIVDTVLALSGDSGFDADGGDFDILRDAVVAAGLAGTLADETAEFTVFAPQDAAFIGLAQTLGYTGASEAGAFAYIVDALALLGGGDPIPLLTDILTYHVVSGSFALADVVALGDGATIATVQGGELTLDLVTPSLGDLDPGLPDPMLIAFDVDGGNGVIHVLDGVLLPLPVSAILGAPFTDLVIGTNAAETISTGIGNDLIDGNGGDDTLTSTGGDDVIFGGAGSDSISSGNGNDTINGGIGAETIDAGIGADEVMGLHGFDMIMGAGGADMLMGNAGNDTVMGNAGNDSLDGGIGADILWGGIGDDVIMGASGADIISGGGGNDMIMGNAGNDLLRGNAGNDTVDGGIGNDTVEGGIGADLLTGAAGADLLSGGGGDDTLMGEAGDDTLSGDRGSDELTGGIGADTFVFGAGFGADTVTDMQEVDTIGIIGADFGVTETQTLVDIAVETETAFVWDLGGGDVLTVLKTETMGTLDASDFALL